MKKYLNLENGLIYTANGRTEKKVVLGKEFMLMQCEDNNGNCYLVPIDKLNNKTYYKPI